MRRATRGRATAQETPAWLVKDAWVMTPQGPGQVDSIWADTAVVVMDFAYHVRYAVDALQPIEARGDRLEPCVVCGEPTRYRCSDCDNAACPRHVQHGRGVGRQA